MVCSFLEKSFEKVGAYIEKSLEKVAGYPKKFFEKYGLQSHENGMEVTEIAYLCLNNEIQACIFQFL